MKIVLKNNNNEVYTIRRFNGIQVNIPANDYIVLNISNQSEIKYWTTVNLDQVGLSLITNESLIRKIEQLILKKNATNTTNTPLVDSIKTTKNINTVTNIKNNSEKADVSSNNSNKNSKVSSKTTEVSNKTTEEPKLTKLNNSEINNNTKTIKSEQIVKPIIAENNNTATNNISEKSNKEKETAKTEDKIIKYTEQDLVQLSRRELYTILEKANIEYAKNMTTPKLINLILGKEE